MSFSRLFRRTKILEQLTDLRVNVAPHQRNTANQLRVTSNHAHSWVVSHGLLRNFGLKVGMIGKVRGSRPASGSWSRTCPTWLCWSSRC